MAKPNEKNVITNEMLEGLDSLPRIRSKEWEETLDKLHKLQREADWILKNKFVPDDEVDEQE